MINYIVYDSTGTIIKTGSCPNDHLDLQVEENQFVIEGVANDATDVVDTATKKVVPNGKPAPPSPEPPDVASQIRSSRDRLLARSDWTQVPDSPLPAATKALWATYRQALRDIPNQAGFPNTVNWPTQPS